MLEYVIYKYFCDFSAININIKKKDTIFRFIEFKLKDQIIFPRIFINFKSFFLIKINEFKLYQKNKGNI